MTVSRNIRNSLLAATFLVTVTISFAPAASAETPFCLPGSGAGQCSNPQGVAVDTELQRVYVADSGNHRVNVFDTDGDLQFSFGWGVVDGGSALQQCGPQAVPPTAACQKGIAGAGVGQFSSPRRIAVDDTGGPEQGSIYVGTDNFRVQKFDSDGDFLRMWGWDVVASGPGNDTAPPLNEFEVCVDGVDVCKTGVSGKGGGQFSGQNDPITVGPSGVVYVGDNALEGADPARIEKFEPSGAFVEEVTLTALRSPQALAVDSTGDFYAKLAGDLSIHKYKPDATEYGSPYPLDVGIQTNSLAVDAADNLFAGQRQIRVVFLAGSGAFQVITVADSSGSKLSRFGYGAMQNNIEGLAPFSSPAGDVFAGELGGFEGKVHYLAIPPPGPIVAPPSLEAAPGNTKATLRAEINPEGKATTYHFEYLTQEAFEDQGGFTGPATKSTSESASVGADFNLHLAEAAIGCTEPTQQLIEEGKCLIPDTQYRFRVVAKDSEGKEDILEGAFETKAALELKATWATEVGVDAARLHAEVNPLGIPASGYFEYVSEAAFSQSGFAEAAQAPDVSGGEAPLDFGAGEAPIARSASIGSLQPGTTYRYRAVISDPFLTLSGPAHLFRTFPQVSVPQESCANAEFRTGLAAFLPDCRAYELVSPLEKNSGDIIPLEEPSTHLPAGLNQSSLSGERITYSSYRSFGEQPDGSPYTSQYIAARDPDPKVGWQTHPISPKRGTTVFKLSPGLQLDTEYKAFSADLCQAWLRPATDPPLAPGAIGGYANVYRRTDEECGGKSYQALTPAEPPNRLPDYYYPLEFQGASADGSHGIFIAPDNLTETAPNIGEGTPETNNLSDDLQLYEWTGTELRFVCILPNGAPTLTPCVAGTNGGLSNGDSRTATVQNAISDDGSRIFWSDDPVGAGKIYLRDSKGTEATEDDETLAVSAQAEAEAGTSVSRYWTAAADGSKAIFTSGGKLYEFDVESETTTLIAPGAIGVMGASEDASRIYFGSTDALTGEEENSEGDKAEAGKPNLYLYREGTISFIGTLASADLDPSVAYQTITPDPRFRPSRVSPDGEHAAFMSTAPLTGYDNADALNGKAAAEVFLYDAGTAELICASCNPSGARPTGANIAIAAGEVFWAAAHLPVWQNTLSPPRPLADDGSRLYFEASDALSTRDTNGARDVYQWEQEGIGGCDAEDPGFAPDSGGCIELISAGKSSRPSELVDADPSGENVFIATVSGLVPQDYGLVDVYDARVGGGFPPPPPPQPECEGEACQSAPAPPQAPTPASFTYRGPGDVQEGGKPRKRRCAKGKRVVRRGGKARCVGKAKGKRGNQHRHRRQGR